MLQNLKAFKTQFSLQLNHNRKRILKQFESGAIEYLVCTDALARGIDIGQVDKVVSYDCPSFIKTYIHRVGRTARAGALGTAVTIVEKSEKAKFHAMLKEAGKENVKKIEVEITEDDEKLFQETKEAAAKVLEQEKQVAKSKRSKNSNKRKRK